MRVPSILNPFMYLLTFFLRPLFLPMIVLIALVGDARFLFIRTEKPDSVALFLAQLPLRAILMVTFVPVVLLIGEMKIG